MVDAVRMDLDCKTASWYRRVGCCGEKPTHWVSEVFSVGKKQLAAHRLGDFIHSKLNT